MKKTLAMVLAMGMTIASLTACGGSKPAETTAAATEAQTEAASSAADTKAEATEPAGGKAEGPITVVSREDGSGTRGAFIELFGIETKNDAWREGRQHHRGCRDHQQHLRYDDHHRR